MNKISDKLQKRIAYINARVVNYDTGERWVDENGNTVNIERAPINWGRAFICQTTKKLNS